jgi:hypothetical protein
MISPHAQLEALIRFPHDPMTTAEMADVLGVHEKSVGRALLNKRMEGTMQNLGGRGKVMRYKVSKSAGVKWLWESAGGDKAVLKEAIDQLCPEMWRLLLKGGEAKAGSGQEDRPLPDNVIPMRGRRKPAAPQVFEHPDLFQTA